MREFAKHSQDEATYAAAGVDISAGNKMVGLIRPAVQTTARPGADATIGGFGGIFDLKKAGFTDPLLIAASDGVGTKVKLAAETAIHDMIGIDLVAMCVNDLVVQGGEPLFFLDYYASGVLDPTIGATIVGSIATGCRQAGCALIGGETAEMPGLYKDKDYDLAGFAVGAVERGELLPRTNLTAGDVLLGLASSGLHSNGFSLVRYIVEQAGLEWHDPAPFMNSQSLGISLLTPTRIYVKSLLSALRSHTGIKAMAHITGGGFQENIPRILTNNLAAEIDLSSITPSPVFGWLSRQGRVSQEEMLRTFNCGVGMVVVAAAEQAQQITDTLSEAGEIVHTMGMLVKRHINKPQIHFTGMLHL